MPCPITESEGSQPSLTTPGDTPSFHPTNRPRIACAKRAPLPFPPNLPRLPERKHPPPPLCLLQKTHASVISKRARRRRPTLATRRAEIAKDERLRNKERDFQDAASRRLAACRAFGAREGEEDGGMSRIDADNQARLTERRRTSCGRSRQAASPAQTPPSESARAGPRNRRRGGGVLPQALLQWRGRRRGRN